MKKPQNREVLVTAKHLSEEQGSGSISVPSLSISKQHPSLEIKPPATVITRWSKGEVTPALKYLMNLLFSKDRGKIKND